MVKNCKTRPAAVAGKFYPADPVELRSLVESLLREAGEHEDENDPPSPRLRRTGAAVTSPGPKALIAPHAGYVYSGPIAATAYASWLADRRIIRRIVLLGPAHFADVEGLALSSAECFETPLGAVTVDRAGVRQISTLPQVKIVEAAHAREHSLEVQLPFLQVVLEEFTLVPLAVGIATPDEIREVLEVLWGGAETRIVVSSDLSHFLNWESARALDQATARAIESLSPDAIRSGQACGGVPIRGLLEAARKHHLRASTLDLRNSGDTAGERDRVVGYGAFAFEGRG